MPRAGYIDNSGSAHIVFGESNVRPAYTHFLEPAILIADASLAGHTCEACWHATSTSVSGITEGTMTIAVEPQACDVIALMARGPSED